MKEVDLFIKSYRPDFWLLYLSLETIKRNVTGYNNIILLIPEEDKEVFDTRNMPPRTKIFYVEERKPGWLWQQWCKLSAHLQSDADFILFSDSDAFWEHPVNVQDIVKDGKPEILYTDWRKVGDAIVWRKPTEEFMKEPVEWEFMRRLPLCYHKSTLIGVNHHEINLEHIIMRSDRFSEFNILGAWAFKNQKELYNFVNTDDWNYVPPLATQVWSHASKAKGQSETHHLEYIRTLETIIKAFQLPLPE